MTEVSETIINDDEMKFKDSDTVVSHSKFIRGLLLTLGTIFAIVGLVGAFIPFLPTTPLLLLAAACYMHSSRRMYIWLMSNPIFGKFLRQYRSGLGITIKSKVIAIIFLWFSLSTSTIFLIPKQMWWAQIIMLAIALGVTIHILRIKTYIDKT